VKRFYSEVRVLDTGAGHALALDEKPVRTPAGAPCAAPSRPLAEAMAEEWRVQGERIDPLSMPLTRAANAAIDRVARDRVHVEEIIAGYGETDLLCHRAPHPEGLVARQRAGWDPMLQWAESALGARLAASEGVMPLRQDPEALARLRGAVAAHGAWQLTALHELVTLTGSLVLGLAVSHGRLAPEEGWRLGRIDEDWNIEQWGEDAEAAAQAARRRRDFMAAARLLRLLEG
jgi:chaperone required for assembly of F1-ATPase